MAKSTLASLLLFIAALALVGWTQSRSPLPAIESHPGRYQLVMHPTIRADAYLLDTQTGKIWQRFVYTNVKGKPDVWVYQERLDTPAEKYAWEIAAPKEAE